MKDQLLPPQRISSIDAYRGFVMFLMMAEVLRLSKVAESFPDSAVWAFLDFHQSHVPWTGCSLHDLIQPSFSFLVGVALPYSISSRASRQQNTTVMWLHTIRRSLTLILLGIFLRSMHSEQTNFTFEDTLTQIGLGYPFLFALGFGRERVQWSALGAILLVYWAAFAFYPLPGPYFDWSQTGNTADWEHNLTGFAAHWNKNTNIAWAFDRWFLNIFPRPEPFLFNGGGYSTLSFIPTLGTMILGLVAGKWLKTTASPSWFLKRLGITAAILFASALVLHFTGVNPIVKRIWTPAWTLSSGGWCMTLLALFYFIADIKQQKRLFFPLIVIGTNSIVAYVMAETIVSFIDSSFRINLSQTYDMVLGQPYQPLVRGAVILLVEWGILYWLYARKIFIRI